MSVVDVSDLPAGLFILDIIFLLLIFGCLSFGILQFFQQRFRRGWFSIAGAVVSLIVFIIVMNVWYL